MLKTVATTVVVLLMSSNSYSTAPFLEWRPKQFVYDGHIFFNATSSAVQGEQFLLNQQLSNIKLGFELQMNDWNTTKGLFIYNTLPTPMSPQLYLDQIYHEFKNPDSYWFVGAGKRWLPFGSSKSELIYKPLTKALGQTNELTAMIGYISDCFMNLSLFNPNSEVHSPGLPYYNLNMGIHKKNYDIGGSYLNSLAEGQIFQYNKGFGGFLKTPIRSEVPGMSGYIHLNYKKVGATLTYVTAIHPFLSSELSYNGKGAMPKAVSIQAHYDLTIKKIPIQWIGFFDYSNESLALRLPNKRVGMGIVTSPKPYLTAQFQYFKDYEYASENVATGLNKSIIGSSAKVNTFALQLILNF